MYCFTVGLYDHLQCVQKGREYFQGKLLKQWSQLYLLPPKQESITILSTLAFIEQLFCARQCSKCFEYLLFIQFESSIIIIILLQVRVAQSAAFLPKVNYIGKYRTWSHNPDLSNTHIITSLFFITYTPHYFKTYFPECSTYITDGKQKFFTQCSYIFIFMSIKKY